METNFIAKVNNVDIIAISENSSSQLVPIRPICEALGIDPKSQRDKINSDEILSSIGVLSTSVAGDGKEREMLSLPLEFVFGWLFTINPKNVSDEARQSIIRYKLECYRALYEYFTEPQTFLKQKQAQMESLVEVYQEKQNNFKNARVEMNAAKKQLNEVMAITIEEWRANKRQLSINFEDHPADVNTDDDV